MALDLARELAELSRRSVAQLRTRFAELFGDTTPANNKTWLVRRIAWRLQARAEGDLSQRARDRAAELADDADLRMNPPQPRQAKEPAPATPLPTVVPLSTNHDRRLPPPGSVLTRSYKGRDVRVLVRADGFEHDGTLYPSLSAAAKAVTGSHCNGFLFFKLIAKGDNA